MRRVLKFAAIGVAISALLVVYLMRFHGLRIERDGSGIWPIVSFYQEEEHMAAIGRNRAIPAEDSTAVNAPTMEPNAPEVEAEPPKPQELAPAPVKSYWTDFRGPGRDGRYAEMPIKTDWPSSGPKRLWRKPIGGGYASFVFGGGNAYTIEQRRAQEVVAAYDVKNGSEVWSHAWDGFFRESMGGDGPRATPTWNEGRIYALGAEGELRCLDAKTGRRLWSKNILRENGADNLQWGMAAAPLIVDNVVIVQPGGSNGKSVVAYDKLTGEPVWQSLNDKQAYTSPMLVTLAGRRQILIVTGQRAAGLTPEGKLLWEYPWTTSYDINAAQPVVIGPDEFILSAGYGHGASLIRIARSGDSFTATAVWENTRMKNKFTSSVLHEGYLYGLDEAILACVDAKTGELKWKGGRYGYGQLVLASGHLIVATEDGDVALVRAAPEKHEEIVRFPAIEGKTWNHPALSDGVLFVRNGAEMSAFQVH